MNVNLGRPAGALPSVHRTCHSPARKHTQKISETCHNLHNFSSPFLRGRFSGYLCHTKALSCGHKPWSKLPSTMKAGCCEKIRASNHSISSSETGFILSCWLQTSSIHLHPFASTHILHSQSWICRMSCLASPGISVNFETRKRSCCQSSTGSCRPCSYQEDHRALVMTHFSQASTKNALLHKKLMIMMKNNVRLYKTSSPTSPILLFMQKGLFTGQHATILAC